MAYIPKSNNPHITTAMLQKALYMVKLKEGPETVQQYIKQRLLFRLLIDNIRRKLVASPINDEIIIEIDFSDIVYAVCLDANESKELRHRIRIATKNGDIYLFYVDIPYQWDPLPFLQSLNYQIDCQRNPEAHKYDSLKSYLGLGFVALVVIFIVFILNL